MQNDIMKRLIDKQVEDYDGLTGRCTDADYQMLEALRHKMEFDGQGYYVYLAFVDDQLLQIDTPHLIDKGFLDRSTKINNEGIAEQFPERKYYLTIAALAVLRNPGKYVSRQ